MRLRLGLCLIQPWELTALARPPSWLGRGRRRDSRGRRERRIGPYRCGCEEFEYNEGGILG